MSKICFLFFLCSSFFLDGRSPKIGEEIGLIKWTKPLVLREFPLAFNPSMIRNEQGYLMVFRFCPNNHNKDHTISKLGIVQLDEEFHQLSKASLIEHEKIVTPHMEDPRIFRYQEEIYILYSNCLDEVQSLQSRRDIWIGKLEKKQDRFVLKKPVKLVYKSNLIQKNWIPFISKDQLYLIYLLDPFEVILPDLCTGECKAVEMQKSVHSWQWGHLRGGTVPIEVDGELLAFFHSSPSFTSRVGGKKISQYFIGAYTFSASPPFTLTSMTKEPIISKTFYDPQSLEKKVIFPGGLVEDQESYVVCYGKNDQEIWMASFDKWKLKQSLITLKTQKE